MPTARRILHVDMDAFYASVEQRDDPSLRGKPVAVGGSPAGRGVVAAASYEAREFGVRSAMPMARAVRLCPSLLIVRPDFARYRAASQAVFEIFRSVTSLVEPLSLDEAYLDVTENSWGEVLGQSVARRLKQEIRDMTGLTASAGVAPNKFLAKIASAWKKPDGLTVIAPERVEQFLDAADGRCAVGCGSRHRAAVARPRNRATARRAGRRGRRVAGSRRQPVRLAAETRSRHRRSSGDTAPGDEVVRHREHVLVRPHGPDADSRGNRRDGARRRGVAGTKGAALPHGDDQGPLFGLHDRHAEPHADAAKP